MEIKLRCLLCELFFWLSAELILGYIEYDNLADYCEYLKQRDAIAPLVLSSSV